MATLKRLILLTLILAVAAALPSFADAPDAYESARVVARTEIWKDINSGVAGSATVAITDGGKVVYSEGFGMADREKSIPVDGNTIFNIGSISKVFAAVAVMQLVDDGKVRLDDPVTRYLPDFTMADPRYREITVRMLLNHSSGLPGTTGANNFGFRYHADVFRQVLANLAAAHLKHRPGAFSPYTNDGFTLAEMIVERVSGIRFIDFLSRRVFGPLSLGNTGLSVGERPDKNAAFYYWPAAGKKEPLEVLSVLGAGGLSSTAEDLCRFQDSFSGSGPQILSAASLAEMKKGQPSGFNGKLPHSDTPFGLGWDMTDLPTYRAKGIQVIGKSGGTGRYTSMMFTVPGQRISVAVIESAESGNSFRIALKVLNAVLAKKGLLEEKPAAVTRPPARQAIPSRYAAYAGCYLPFHRISFDLKKNGVTMRAFENGKEGPPVSLFYHDGWFLDEAGRQFAFASVEGEDYCLMYSRVLDIDSMVGQKLKRVERPVRMKIAMNGRQWLLRSASWFEGVQGTKLYVMTSRTYSFLPGYVDFGGVMRVKAPGFAGMAAGNIRDLSELTLVEREGATWARLSENLYSPATSARLIGLGTSTVTIGAEGLCEWLTTGEELIVSFERPAESRAVVFSPEGEPRYDSMVDVGPVLVAKGSFIEVAGQAGTTVKVTAK